MGESLNCLEKIKKKIIERTRFHSVEDSRWSHTLVQQHIPNKSEFKFIQLDIKEFYPSVTKETLSNIITLEENYVSISNKDIQITKHCMKSLLLYENEAWKKKKILIPYLMLQWGVMMVRNSTSLLGFTYNFS